MLLYQAKLFLFSSEITQLRKIDYQLIVRKEKIKAVRQRKNLLFLR